MHASASNQTGRLLNEKEVAEILGISVRTLQSWRVKGGELKFIRLGRAVRYRQCDLDEFVQGNLKNSTSEAGAP
ncbi:DNA binding domain, excisionase family [Roseibium album]|nr:DNA binding domain, excisionase family [Roseibium album]